MMQNNDSIDFKGIAQDLNSIAEDYCRFILPSGTRNGSEYHCGSVGGEKGRSLSICVAGDRIGVWRDFAGSDGGGDLISLTAAVKNFNQVEAAKSCANFLGKPIPPEISENKVHYTRPKSQNFKQVSEHSLVHNYLVQHRFLHPEIIRYYWLCEENKNFLIFPFVDEKKDLVSAKRKNVATNGPSIFTQKGLAPSLYGWYQVHRNHFNLDENTIVITESEIDCMTVTQCGLLALSMPNGALGLSWFDTQASKLKKFDRIILCFDMDDAGESGAAKLYNRFLDAGYENISIASLPKKDPNDCLKSGMDLGEIKKILLDAKQKKRTIIGKNLSRFSEFFDEILAYEKLIEDPNYGISLPWENNYFKWRPGELSILTGVPGHGKTQFLNQVIIHTILTGTSVLMASPEMNRTTIGHALHKQATGHINPSDAIKKKVCEKVFENLVFHTLEGEINIYNLLTSIESKLRTENINLITIDNLSMCNVQSDNNGLNQQRKAVAELKTFAKRNNIHIILVAHPRKLVNTHIPAQQYDVSGSSAIVNIPDNVFCFWRNERKESLIKKSKYSLQGLTEDEIKILDHPDARFICHKNRFDGKKFTMGLWFEPLSGQFLLKDQAPIRYISQFTET